MAFNHNYQVEYPRRIPLDSSPLQRTSSILSDSQSLWVLFSPSVHASGANESDILSFSNNSRATEDGTQASQASPEGTQYGYLAWGTAEQASEQSEGDSLIDNLADEKFESGAPLALVAGHQPGRELHSRIDKWRTNPVEDMVDDNIASWDLDEDLSQQVDQSDDTGSGIEVEKAFYGDTLFSQLSGRDYVDFKKVERNLKHSLGRHPYLSNLPLLLNQILYKLVQSPLPQQMVSSLHRLNDDELRTYSSLLRNNRDTRSFLDSIIDTHLKNSQLGHAPANKRSISDSTLGSSLILCGGSWNEL